MDRADVQRRYDVLVGLALERGTAAGK